MMQDTELNNLRYVTTQEDGLQRKKRGRGFTYTNTKGKTIQGSLREWIEGLAIPPAWTDVWISPYKNAHILATGRDDKGRKQYIYHSRWRETRDQKKFDRLYAFGQALPSIRKTTEKHLRQRKLSRTRVLAAIVRLLETSLIRVGNDEYAQANDSYGLTTLEDDHASIVGSEVIFNFVGKSGQEHAVTLHNRRLARIVKHCQDIPGHQLFQYYDENGDHHVIDSSDVNAYLKEITGEEFTAKVFRTWGGSTQAIKYLCENSGDSADDSLTKACIAHVAESLGNTKVMSRKYYIHPAIFDAFSAGHLLQTYQKYEKKSAKADLYPEESTLLEIIKNQ